MDLLMRRNIMLFLGIFVLNLPTLFSANQAIAQEIQQAFTGKNAVEGRQILILDGVQEGLPQPEAQIRGLMGTLKKQGFKSKNLYVEHLDLARYPDPTHRANLTRLLSRKFGQKRIDLIIAINQQAFEFVASNLKDLMPNVPVLLENIQIPPISWDYNNRKIMNLYFQTDMAGTLDYAIKIFPDTRRLVVINGRDDRNVPFLAATSKAIAGLGKKLEVEFTEKLSYEEMLRRIATLPPHTVALLGPYFNDLTGRYFVPAEVASEVSQIANVPVFSQVDILIFQGLFGGSTVISETVGKRGGQIALDYLNGDITLTKPITRFKIDNVPLFNWPQLERWKVDANKLPANSIFFNRPPTLWGQYKAIVISTLLFIGILIALISALTIQNRRRKKAVEALRESEESFRSLFEDHSAVKFVIDPATGNIIRANHAAATYYGWSRDELTQMKIQDINRLPPEEVREDMEKASIAQKDHFEYQHRRSDGSIRDVEVFASNVEMEGQRYLHSIIHDITDRKKIEAELRASEKRNRRILHSSMDGFWRVDAQRRILEVNEAYCRMSGYSPEEILTMRVQDFEALESPEDVVGRASRITQTGSDRFVSKHHRKDGSLLDVEISIQYGMGEDGGEYAVFLRDITEQRRTEARLRQAQKMEAVGTLAGGIAHDFNNILFPIVGLSEMLLEDLPPDSPTYEDMMGIFKAGKRGRDLAKQILAIGRQKDQQHIPVRFQTVLKEVLKLSKSTIPSFIGINQHIKNDCGLIFADPTQLHQIAMNLITNAYHAVEKNGGEISVQLKETKLEDSDLEDSSLTPGRYAVFSVSDTGHGIEPTNINRIFDPYFTTKGQGKGTGLGLAVVYGIVKDHKGEIKVYSELGKGTSFNVFLPLINEEHDAAQGAEHAGFERGSESVLVVDDEEPVVLLVKRILQKLGYKVTTRTSSPDALEAFRQSPNSYDLVISDITMPNMLGQELAKRLIMIRPDIPIILCTGFSERINSETAPEHGIKGFLMKPILRSELAKMVRKVLDEAAGKSKL